MLPVLHVARAEVAAGRRWKARDRLLGALPAHGADQELLGLLGEVLFAMGDHPEAGRFWALTERDDETPRIARAALEERVAMPLQAAGGEVLETVRAVLASGGNLEASARALFVHPNTVRYRLKRAAELTGLWATDPRGSWTVQVALALAKLPGERSLWH